MADDVRGILEVALGALDANIVARFEEGDVAGNVTLLIGLETSYDEMLQGVR
jgi:hypothetical protein